MRTVRAMMIGDVVGEPGLGVLERDLPALTAELSADFVVVNGENAAEGFGLTDATLARIFAAGADAVTSGNHVWEKRDFWPTLDSCDRLLRPANFPEGAVGRGWLLADKVGVRWLVVNLQGRDLMTPIDCPFRAFDRIIALAAGSSPAPLVLVDFHAETTREKESLGYHLDGRASLVAGTHTHVPTADERILPGGTAYVTDLGMTGAQDGVIGMDAAICMERSRKQVLYRMAPAADSSPDGSASRVCGLIAEIDADTGRALSVRRI